MIETPATASPRCSCTVDLLSKVFRPYNFLVTVTGEPPHAFVRRYKVAAPTDDEAAHFGLQRFTQECMRAGGIPKVILDEMADLAPGAKLQ